ncbi:unnamed protein product [Parnassius apollo]|uniref:(apollo) hypothetical protein n=1 Tax=Parnassius apollo TaxID=110799 RepID=A0A8S3XSE6_PARAO|nr:unnamed protein product [Parnassius apollo]
MKSFKDRWDVELVKWQRLHYGVPLSKKEFSRMIGPVWAQIDPQILSNGFKKGGIWPFNPAAVEETKFDALKLNHWKEHIRTNNPALSYNDLPVNDVIQRKEPHTLLFIALNVFNQNFIATDNPGYMKTGKLMLMNNDIDDSSNNLDLRQPIEEKNVTFEELLLQKVKRGDNSEKIKRSRVAPGAEVITHNDVIRLKKRKTT